MQEKDPTQKIYISRTEREWQTIEKRMKAIGRTNLSAYVMGRITLLERQYADNPNGLVSSIPKRVQKPLFIKESSLRIVSVINLKTGIPIATIIDRLILDPFILPLDK